ncbi:MAG: hypothetical protein JNK82_27340 [Myxococcaceae bacterium]|nr:hypothetical protein [Myxococcaceae bacterium]
MNARAGSGWGLVLMSGLLVGVGCTPPNGQPPGGAGGGSNTGPVVTAPGTVTGAALTADIGPAGGKLSTADGKVELIVPAGALTAMKQLSLTPITNGAPLNVGPALRFLPDGTTFTTPAKLVLHYETFGSSTSPELLLAVTHDAQGQWVPQGKPVVDTAAKTVTVEIGHFSDWSFAACAKLEIDNYLASEGVDSHLSVQQQCDDPMTQTLPLGPVNRTTAAVEWRKVDAMGQPGPGTLTPQGANATVTAPASAPSDPRVTITASWEGPNGMRQFRETMAVGTTLDFTIDGSTVIVPTMSQVMTVMGKSIAGGGTQAGSFSVQYSGTGEGGFASDPEGGNGTNAMLGNVSYTDSYQDPCGGSADIHYLVNRVSVSHANREKGFIVGSFSGQLAVTRGMIQCGTSMVPNVEIVPVTGAFITRWLVY